MGEFLNIDCMEGMAEYPDKYFDLAIVDPPYGIGDFTEKKYTKFQDAITWNNEIPKKRYFEELKRVSKNQIIWGANYYTEFLKPTKSWIIWDKKNPVANGHVRAEMAWSSLKFPTNICDIVWTAGWYSAKRENLIHPCQKPIALYRWLLENYAKEGDLILDTHVGSASSLIACEALGFDYVGYEIDKDYYEAAKKRLEEWRSLPLFDEPKNGKLPQQIEIFDH